MALLPAASAVSANVSLLKTSTPLLQESASIQGCAKAKAAMPQLSLLTGAGREAGLSSSAKTCSKALGGAATQSYGDASAEIGVTKALKLKVAATTLNASFDIKAAVMTMAHGTFSHCPTTTNTGSYTISSGTAVSSVTYTDTSSYCTAQATWEMFLEMYVEDQTSGTFTFGGFSSMYNNSGNYYDKYNDVTNYSSPNATLGWTNATYSGTSTGSYGLSNSTVIAWTPTGVVSGSWASGDNIVFYAYLYLYADSAVEYEHGAAAAKIVAGGSVGHVDITGVNLS